MYWQQAFNIPLASTVQFTSPCLNLHNPEHKGRLVSLNSCTIMHDLFLDWSDGKRSEHTHTHTHTNTDTHTVIGSCVLLTAGVVSGVDTSLTHLSLTWRSRQHFASVTHKHWHTHTHTHTFNHYFSMPPRPQGQLDSSVFLKFCSFLIRPASPVRHSLKKSGVSLFLTNSSLQGVHFHEVGEVKRRGKDRGATFWTGPEWAHVTVWRWGQGWLCRMPVASR